MLVANAYNTFDLVRSPKNSDGDNFKESFVLARHEIHIGAEHTERLVDDVTAAFLHHDGFHIGRSLSPGSTNARVRLSSSVPLV